MAEICVCQKQYCLAMEMDPQVLARGNDKVMKSKGNAYTLFIYEEKSLHLVGWSHSSQGIVIIIATDLTKIDQSFGQIVAFSRNCKVLVRTLRGASQMRR
ncbi:hypothetical protein KP509_1Z165200 [Ceratopteris richardii]|nr:hypothetical protein KP509_1Z165200 [Ceratopteris richardii]